jgi:hypothetical protein
MCVFSALLFLLCSTLGYRSGLYAQELQEQGILLSALRLAGGTNLVMCMFSAMRFCVAC